jgi:hypothetical protein
MQNGVRPVSGASPPPRRFAGSPPWAQVLGRGRLQSLCRYIGMCEAYTASLDFRKGSFVDFVPRNNFEEVRCYGAWALRPQKNSSHVHLLVLSCCEVDYEGSGFVVEVRCRHVLIKCMSG